MKLSALVFRNDRNPHDWNLWSTFRRALIFKIDYFVDTDDIAERMQLVLSHAHLTRNALMLKTL